MIQLGLKVRDKVSEFVGIATSRVEYLNGCVQFGVTPKAIMKDGKYPEVQYIDVERLEVVGRGVTLKKKPTGGYRFDSPKR